MKSRCQILSLIFGVLGLVGPTNVPLARADWLAMDGQNTIWRLSDTNGAVIGQFATLSPYHQEWTAIGAGLGGKIDTVKNGGDTTGNNIQIFAPDGTQVGSIVLGPFNNGDLYDPGALTVGPDGNVYIADNYWNFIAHYSSTNGAFLGTMVTNARVNGLTFGPDGNLYVADASLGVVRYNGTNGSYVDTFVPLGANGVPDAANLVFGPDGNLYICSVISNAVIRFNDQTGQFMDYFVSPGNGGLSSPKWLAFGPDGNLYVAGSGGTILQYDGQTGAFLGSFGSHAVLGLVHLPNPDPPPLLTIQLTGANTVQISWPSSAGTNWTLCCQWTTCSINGWTTITNSPALDGTNYSVIEPCAATACFYRLQQ